MSRPYYHPYRHEYISSPPGNPFLWERQPVCRTPQTDTTDLKTIASLRHTLEEARVEIVIAIAFIGRDRHSQRLQKTLDDLLTRLSIIDGKIIETLDHK